MEAAHRWSVGSRVAAAVIGGYVATGLLAAAMANWLPMAKAEATHLATLCSFAFYVGIVLAVFHTSSASRAWALVAVIAAVAAAALMAGSV